MADTEQKSDQKPQDGPPAVEEITLDAVDATTPVKAPPATEPEDLQTPTKRVVEIPPCPSTEHALHTSWSFWFDKRIKSSVQENKRIYMENLKHLCCFNSVESFWRNYTYLIKPSGMPRECNLHLFRETYFPMWESFPNGGCWILKVGRRSATTIDKVWETLVMGAIGELFEEPDLVGIVLSVRQRQDMISIWNRDNQSEAVRFAIGEKLKQILNLSPTTVLEYKKHCTSMKDNSTYRNAKLYVAGAS